MIQQPVHAEIGHPAPHENLVSLCGHMAMGVLQLELIQSSRFDHIRMELVPATTYTLCKKIPSIFISSILLENWKLVNPCADLPIHYVG